MLHRFNCGRWFARSDDDGSVERFLVAEKVPLTLAKMGTMSSLGMHSQQMLLNVLAVFCVVASQMWTLCFQLPPRGGGEPTRRLPKVCLTVH